MILVPRITSFSVQVFQENVLILIGPAKIVIPTVQSNLHVCSWHEDDSNINKYT
jgi:hypothetical protein